MAHHLGLWNLLGESTLCAPRSCPPNQRIVQLQRPGFRYTRCRATSGDADSPSSLSSMTTEDACTLLGVTRHAGFEEVLSAKKRLLRSDQDPSKQRVNEVETAYDVLLMQSMKRRIGGTVDSSVRFADVAKAQPNALQQFLNYSPAPQQALVRQSAAFSFLALLALIQGFQPPADLGQDVPGLQLALAFGAAFYFARERRMSVGKALGLCAAGAGTGALLGTLLQTFLRVDVVPFAGLSSPGTLVSEPVFLGLWAACSLFA